MKGGASGVKFDDLLYWGNNLSVSNRLNKEARVLPSYQDKGPRMVELLEQINLMGLAPSIRHDQWWGVRIAGTLEHCVDSEKELEVKIWKTGEDLVHALERATEALQAEWEKLNGRPWEQKKA